LKESDHWQVNAIAGCNRICQLTCKGDTRLDLLENIVLIDVVVVILGCVIIRILFTIVILDLDGCDDTLLTEGTFIPSATIRDDLWRQIEIISSDYTG
jgi:hypothetical protein